MNLSRSVILTFIATLWCSYENIHAQYSNLYTVFSTLSAGLSEYAMVDLDMDRDLDIDILNNRSESFSLFGDVLGAHQITNDISIYPNPTHGIIDIENGEDVKIQAVYNSKEIPVVSTTDLSGLPSGTYFINLTKENVSQTIKIIKTD
ncbi:MAG: T9SS type A sorting domain-containing protein [Bacteroidota bacterium]